MLTRVNYAIQHHVTKTLEFRVMEYLISKKPIPIRAPDGMFGYSCIIPALKRTITDAN